MATVSKAGVTVDSEDDLDLMGDIFYVSVPLTVSASQPPDTGHFRYSPLTTHPPNILLW